MCNSVFDGRTPSEEGIVTGQSSSYLIKENSSEKVVSGEVSMLMAAPVWRHWSSKSGSYRRGTYSVHCTFLGNTGGGAIFKNIIEETLL